MGKQFRTIYFFGIILLGGLSAYPVASQSHDFGFYSDVLIHASEYDHRRQAHQIIDQRIDSIWGNDPDFTSGQVADYLPTLMAPDSSFRMVTWALIGENGVAEQFFGRFQWRGEDEITALTDQSQRFRKSEFGRLPANRWLGAVYNRLIQVPGLDSVYVLEGKNVVNEYSYLHILEILDLRGSAIRFGAPLWENDEEELSDRKIFSVARGARFQPQMNQKLLRVVVDHLRAVPYNGDRSKMVRVPDGTYVVWEWNGEYWEFNDRLFDDVPDGEPIRNPEKRKEAKKKDLFGDPVDGRQ